MGLLSDSDVGKAVFDSDENLLGEVIDVGDDGALIRTDADTDADVLSPFEWERDADQHLPSEQVDRVNPDGVYTRPL